MKLKDLSLLLGCLPAATLAKQITVHVIPHSHDDVGWQKTLDEYFDGTHKEIANTGVGIELSSIVDALHDNPERKFSEVEMKFFSMWWEKQSE